MDFINIIITQLYYSNNTTPGGHYWGGNCGNRGTHALARSLWQTSCTHTPHGVLLLFSLFWQRNWLLLMLLRPFKYKFKHLGNMCCLKRCVKKGDPLDIFCPTLFLEREIPPLLFLQTVPSAVFCTGKEKRFFLEFQVPGTVIFHSPFFL